MPGDRLAYSRPLAEKMGAALPSWVRPENESVLDPWYRAPIREVIKLLGLDDPGQIVGLGGAMDVGKMTGGAAGALAKRFPRLMETIGTPPKGLGTLAKTIARTDTPGVYGLKPQVQDRLAHFYEVGQRLPGKADWEGASTELLEAFGGDVEKMRLWGRVWGATSPGTSAPVTNREALVALEHALRNPGVEMTVEQAQQAGPRLITMAPSKVPNINRAYRGETLSPGTKVEAMAGFMVGDPRIPIDVHALHAVGAATDRLDPEYIGLRTLMSKWEKLPLKGPNRLTDINLYLRYEQALRDTLQAFEPERKLNPIFAQLWEGTRAAKGLKPQGGPTDLLRKKGLLEPGAMLDPDRLVEVLKTQGWSAGAIGGLLAAIPFEATQDPAPAVAPALGAQ